MTFQEKENVWIVSSTELKVIVYAAGRLEFQNKLGQTLRKELPPQQRAKLSRQIKSEGWVHQAQLRVEEHIYGLCRVSD